MELNRQTKLHIHTVFTLKSYHESFQHNVGLTIKPQL